MKAKQADQKGFVSASTLCMFMDMVTSAQVWLSVCLHTCVSVGSFSLRAQCCVCSLMCAPGHYVHVWVGRGNGWLSRWHGPCPSLLQQWVREHINHLKASFCSLPASAPSISIRLHWCTLHIPPVLRFCLHFATSSILQWTYWGHAKGAVVLLLLITATKCINLVIWNAPDS